MDLSLMQDEELVRLSRSDSKAMDYLLNKYKGVVLSCSKSLFILGGDNQDLVQEGMIGLFKAIRDFDEHKNIKFSTFAQICVKRNIYTAITNSNSPKNEPLNKGLSISHTDSSDDDDYFKNLSTDDLGLSEIYNPEDNVINKEKYDEIIDFMSKELSKLEYQVMDLYIIGLTTSEIAKVLGKNEKTTDNAFQRAKNKIRKFLEER
ncbi:MAG: sigma-70 family RNA polymerase sigma factor [Lachnospiraceae bacterium]|nr:sigma-70 family RNA polymerase sigma factor [Lachnospiraceae bacterium]